MWENKPLRVPVGTQINVPMMSILTTHLPLLVDPKFDREVAARFVYTFSMN